MSCRRFPTPLLPWRTFLRVALVKVKNVAQGREICQTKICNELVPAPIRAALQGTPLGRDDARWLGRPPPARREKNRRVVGAGRPRRGPKRGVARTVCRQDPALADGKPWPRVDGRALRSEKTVPAPGQAPRLPR